MKIIAIFLIAILVANVSYAQSIKERLRQVREQEIELLKQAKVKKEVMPKEKEQPCDQDPEELDGVAYYNECYCKSLKYPAVEAALAGHGILYQAQGISEMGDGVTHFDPAERAKYRYTCGVSLSWNPTNTVKFKNIKECHSFVDKIGREVKAKADVVLENLNYGCNAHVQTYERAAAH